jgi:hypothetical protein
MAKILTAAAQPYNGIHLNRQPTRLIMGLELLLAALRVNRAACHLHEG